MTPTLQDSPQFQLHETPTTTGRFGRQTTTIEVRSDVVARMQARVQYYDYKVDPVLVAEAIIDRVCLR
jgi:hypothetical protein